MSNQNHYLSKVIEALNSGQFDVSGGHVYSLQVLHDDWCALLKGEGECNCNPELGATTEAK